MATFVSEVIIYLSVVLHRMALWDGEVNLKKGILFVVNLKKRQQIQQKGFFRKKFKGISGSFEESIKISVNIHTLVLLLFY